MNQVYIVTDAPAKHDLDCTLEVMVWPVRLGDGIATARLVQVPFMESIRQVEQYHGRFYTAVDPATWASRYGAPSPQLARPGTGTQEAQR
jgi:hypothetical protein